MKQWLMNGMALVLVTSSAMSWSQTSTGPLAEDSLDSTVSPAKEPEPGAVFLPVPEQSLSAQSTGSISALQTQNSRENALYSDNAAGMCEVVNGILGDFCSANPEDPGCLALQQ